MNSSRNKLAAAHEKIAHLETRLARLKRGFDPEPLANPISEEQHHELLSRSSRAKNVMVWGFTPIAWSVIAIAAFFMMAIVAAIYYTERAATPSPSSTPASSPAGTSP